MPALGSSLQTSTGASRPLSGAGGMGRSVASGSSPVTFVRVAPGASAGPQPPAMQVTPVRPLLHCSVQGSANRCTRCQPRVATCAGGAAAAVQCISTDAGRRGWGWKASCSTSCQLLEALNLGGKLAAGSATLPVWRKPKVRPGSGLGRHSGMCQAAEACPGAEDSWRPWWLHGWRCPPVASGHLLRT